MTAGPPIDTTVERYRDVKGIQIPSIIYGTAWKEAATETLVLQALRSGFRGIDCANQRKHYHEAGVGAAVQSAISTRLVRREELFLQSKYTFAAGQDHRLPYDPRAPIEQQVAHSLASTLEHLGVAVLDALLLHGPSRRDGLVAADREAWQAIESQQASGHTRLIGVSNMSAVQLEELLRSAAVPPDIVQNRCFADAGWDRSVRSVCKANGIAYQGFSLLTANRQVLGKPLVQQIAQRHQRSVAQIIFRFALEAGMLALTGTSDQKHMAQDLKVFEFCLSDAEHRCIAAIATKSN